MILILTIFLFQYITNSLVDTIDCYVCSTRNNSQRDCDDPFNTDIPLNFLKKDCTTGRKNRSGLFPASTCVKIAGKYSFQNCKFLFVLGHVQTKNKVKLVIRTCSVDSGSLTQDTELVRNSHCGFFRYDSDTLRGCITVCREDGCNSANSFLSFNSTLVIIFVGIAMAFAKTMQHIC